MDKQILSDYIDACELVKETEKDILRLNQKKKTIIQEKVKGSMHEFPYTEQNFKIQGSAYSTEDDDCLRREEDLLKKIDYYLVHDKEREEIAKNGHDQIAARHTYRHRVRELLDY